MKYLYDPPRIFKKMFPGFIWNSKVNRVLLTFDDGPDPETTPIILKELNIHSISALFFCVGENIVKHESLAKEIINAGHVLGNHTYSHRKINMLSVQDCYHEITKCNNAVEKLGYKFQYFRPPYGRFDLRTSKILGKFNLKNVMWSLVTYDYKNNLNIVRFALNKYLRGDSIVVLHDNPKSKGIIVDSIKLVLEEAGKRGYEFGEPAECLN